jgi:hypothetical protein
VAHAEGVVPGLVALGEPGQAALGADAPERLAPAGEELVRVGLVADVPDQPVLRRGEHAVQRHVDLDRAERGAEVPAVAGAGVHDLLAELLAERGELLRRQPLEVGGRVDRVEQPAHGFSFRQS